MSLSFQCPKCRRKYSVPDTLAGKRLQCKGCGQKFRLPAKSAPDAAPCYATRTSPGVRESDLDDESESDWEDADGDQSALPALPVRRSRGRKSSGPIAKKQGERSRVESASDSDSKQESSDSDKRRVPRWVVSLVQCAVLAVIGLVVYDVLAERRQQPVPDNPTISNFQLKNPPAPKTTARRNRTTRKTAQPGPLVGELVVPQDLMAAMFVLKNGGGVGTWLGYELRGRRGKRWFVASDSDAWQDQRVSVVEASRAYAQTLRHELVHTDPGGNFALGRVSGNFLKLPQCNFNTNQTPATVVSVSTARRPEPQLHKVTVGGARDAKGASVALTYEEPVEGRVIITGAPVLNAKKEVIGILSHVAEGGRATMLPLHKVVEPFPGTISGWTAACEPDAIDAQVTLLDPFKQIERAEILISPGTGQLGAIPFDKKQARSPSAARHALSAVEHNLTGSIALDQAQADFSLLQPVIVRRDKTVEYAAPVQVQARTADVEGAVDNAEPSGPPKTAVSQNPVACAIPLRQESFQVSDAVITPLSAPEWIANQIKGLTQRCSFMAEDGSCVYMLTTEGLLLRISLPDGVIRAYVDVDGIVPRNGPHRGHAQKMWINPSKAGIVVSLERDNALQILDPISLRHIDSIPVWHPTRFGSTWSSNTAVVASTGNPRLEGELSGPAYVVVDLKNRRLKKTYSESSFEKKWPRRGGRRGETSVEMSPDGQCVFTNIYRMDLKGDELSVTSTLRWRSVPTEFSPDSQFVAIGGQVCYASSQEVLVHLERANRAAFDITGQRVYGQNRRLITAFDQDGAQLTQYELPKETGSTGHSSHIVVSPTGGRLLAFYSRCMALIEVGDPDKGLAANPQKELKQKFAKATKPKPKKEVFPDAVPDVPVPNDNSAGLNSAVLHRMKAATVFLSTEFNSGTGFLIAKGDGYGLLATNAHVVGTQSKMKAVFYSGTQHETPARADVIAVEPAWDLAILRVTTGNLPEPLVLREALPEKGDHIYVSGFPFGSMLATGGTYPSHNTSQGDVSDIIHPEDETVAVEIAGALNPGNSGGPVMDADGRVIGVATRSNIGARMGLAVPVHAVRTLMDQPAVGLVIEEDGRDDGHVNVAIAPIIVDPRRQLARVDVLYRTVVDEEVALATDVPIDADREVKVFQVRNNDRTFVRLPIPVSQGEIGRSDVARYFVQPRLTYKDGTVVHASTRLFIVASERLLARSRSEPDPEEVDIMVTARNRSLAGEPSLYKQNVKVTPIRIRQKIVPNVCWSRDGETMFVLETSGVLRKLSVPGFVEQARALVDVSVPLNGTADFVNRSATHRKGEIWLGPTRQGVAVSLKKKNALLILDEGNLAQLQRIDLEGVGRFGSSALNDKFVVHLGGSKIALLDLETQQAQIKTLTHHSRVGYERPVLRADGRFCYFGDGPAISRFKFDFDDFRQLEVQSSDRRILDTDPWPKVNRDTSYVTHAGKIRESDDLSKVVLDLDKILGVDRQSGMMLRGITKGIELRRADGSAVAGIQFLERKERVLQCLMHPAGGCAVLVTESRICWVEFPGVDAKLRAPLVKAMDPVQKEPAKLPDLVAKVEAPASRTLAPDVANLLNQATACVLSESLLDATVASGFVVHSQPDHVLVVTNFDISQSKNAELKVVLGEGDFEEERLAATLLYADEKTGISILRVETDEEPVPLQFVDPRVRLDETASAFIMSHRGADGPDQIIGNISSLRYDKLGQLSVIQLDATLKPGISGAAVVDGHGRIIGMAAGAVEGVHFGFARPARFLFEIIKGSSGDVFARDSRREKNSTTVSIGLGLVDPLQQIAGVVVRMYPADVDSPKPEWDFEKRCYVIAGAGRPVKMTLGQGVAQGEITFPSGDVKTVPYYLQAQLTRRDGSQVLSVPIRHQVAFGADRLLVNDSPSSKGWLGTPSGKPADAEPGGGRSRALVGESVLVGERKVNAAGTEVTELVLPTRDYAIRDPSKDPLSFCWSADGKWLYALGSGYVHKFSYPTLDRVRRLDLEVKCQSMQLSARGLVVAARDQLILVDEETLNAVEKISIAGLQSIASVPSARTILVRTQDSRSRWRYRLFDLDSLEMVSSLAISEFKTSGGSGEVVQEALSPDGRMFVSNIDGFIRVCRIDGGTIVLDQVSPSPVRGNSPRFMLGPNSELIAMTGGFQFKTKDINSQIRTKSGFYVCRLDDLSQPVAGSYEKDGLRTIWFDPKSDRVYGMAGGLIKTYDMSGELLTEQKTDLSRVQKAIVHPSGDHLLVIESNKNTVSYVKLSRKAAAE